MLSPPTQSLYISSYIKLPIINIKLPQLIRGQRLKMASIIKRSDGPIKVHIIYTDRAWQRAGLCFAWPRASNSAHGNVPRVYKCAQ